MSIRKIVDIKVVDRRKNGGRIIISTGGKDRDRDRVFPQGAKTENYLKNPVVQWGHNYFDPWATVGRTTLLSVTETGIEADFELRPAANEVDPQNIVLLLWDQDFVRTASIGFIPETSVPNDFGGFDFVSWELLEWSLVPIPANQDALRLAATTYPKAFAAYQKSGRVLSSKNEGKIRDARDNLDEVLAQIAEEDEEGGDKQVRQQRRKIATLDTSTARAWVRQLEVLSDAGAQTVFACFEQDDYRVPDDSTVLRCDDDGNIIEKPDPEAGQTIKRKNVTFVPPIDYGWDATYSIYGRGADEEMVKGYDDWEVVSLSDVIAVLPATKSAQAPRAGPRTSIPRMTRRGIDRAKAALRRKGRQAPPPMPDLDDTAAEQILARLNDISSIAARR